MSSYSGDDVSALVFDIGYSNTKAGFAGEDSPSAVYPSVLGVLPTDPAPTFHQADIHLARGVTAKEQVEIRRALARGGALADPAVVEELIASALSPARLAIVDVHAHPILQAEAVTATRADREAMAEIWFEKFGVPAYFTAKDAVLSCFAAARQSGLVIDVGGGSTKVTAVHAGFALASTSYSSDLGGERLTEELGRALRSRDPPVELRPLYELRASAAASLRAGASDAASVSPAGVTASYREWATAQVIEEAKETACRVAETPFDAEAASKAALLPSVPVEIMGESTVDVGGERFAVPELLFDPTPLGESRHKPLLRAITDVVAAVDVDIRRDLYSSVLVTGGVTQTDGFVRRLEADLASTVADSMFKVRVVASAFGNERRFSSWLGGSVLASLGTFQQLWVSKGEYDEQGANIVFKKCP